MAFTPTVTALCQSSPQIGLGHAVRLGALLDSLPQTWPINAFCDGELTLKYFPKRTHKQGSIEDALQNPNKLRAPATKISIVISDLLAPPQSIWEPEEERTIFVAISDKDWPGFCPDIVINPSDLRGECTYSELPRHNITFSGLPYAPLRKPFQNQLHRQHNREGITFVIGSASKSAAWAKDIIEQLPTAGLTKVTIIVSPTLDNFPALAEIGTKRGMHVRTNLSAEQMLDVYCNSELCIMTGGSAVIEALNTGTPVFSYPIMPDMPEETRILAAWGIVHPLSEEDARPATLRSIIDHYLNNSELLSLLIHNTRKVLDVDGGARICEMIVKTCQMISDGMQKQTVLSAIKGAKLK